MTSSTHANKRFVRAYVDEVFNPHKPERAAEYLTPHVAWHGGTLGTVAGIQNLVGLPRGFIGALPDLHANLYNDDPQGRGIAGVDIYRLAPDGKALEHWNVLQEVPDPTSSASTNGRF